MPKASPKSAAKSAGQKKSSQQEKSSQSQRSQSPEGGSQPTRGKGRKQSGNPAALFEALSSGAAISSVVDMVMKLLKAQHVEAAASSVIALCAQAAGVENGVIDPQRIGDVSNVAAELDELYLRAPDKLTVYPLSDRDPKAKKFRKAFAQFGENLIEAVHGAEEDNFTTTLVPWLSGMAQAKARNFRHAASALMFAMVQGLSKLVADQSAAVEAAPGKKAQAQQQKVLDGLIQRTGEVFAVSLHNSMKDVSPEIRLLAFQHLRHLILTYPATYLTNRYLRYLRIAFSDRKPEIRQEGLDTVVQILGGVEEGASKSHQFLKAFSKQIIEMTSDVDTKCADLALKTSALAIKADFDGQHEGEEAAIKDNGIDRLLASLMDDRSAIRSASGTLLKVFLRCKITGGENSDKVISKRGIMLVTLLSQMRATYKEELPERYLVDAVWGDVATPSQLLSDYKMYIGFAKSQPDVSMACSSLRLLAAIAARSQGPLDLGPNPKDDLRPATRAEKKKFDSDEFLAKLSKDVATSIEDILQQHNEDEQVVAALAELLSVIDLKIFSANRLSSKYKEALKALKIVTAATEDRSVLRSCVAGWRVLAFSEHALAEEALAQLNAVVNEVSKELEASRKAGNRRGSQSQKDEPLAGLWKRIDALSGLVPFKDSRLALKSELRRHVLRKSSSDIMHPLINSIATDCAWQVFQASNENTDVSETLAEFASQVSADLLDLLSADGPATLLLRCEAFIALGDIVALPIHDLSQEQQDALVESHNDLVSAVSRQLKDQLDKMKHLTSTVDIQDSAFTQWTIDVTQQRKEITRWESICTRIAASIARLCAFERIRPSLFPRVLLPWPKLPCKNAADTYKALFHTVRESKLLGADEASLERQMMLAAIATADIDSPASKEELAQLGGKLSMMHFLASDKHAAVVPALVREAVQKQEPALLHITMPYCAKLRTAEAVAIVESINEVDFCDSSPDAKIFYLSLRRAAKLAGPADASDSPAKASLAASLKPAGKPAGKRASGVGKKRGRTLGSAEDAEEDLDLAALVKGSKNPRSMSRATPVKSTGADGWRGRSPAKGSQVPVSQQTTHTNISSMLDDEVFVETQDY